MVVSEDVSPFLLEDRHGVASVGHDRQQVGHGGFFKPPVEDAQFRQVILDHFLVLRHLVLQRHHPLGRLDPGQQGQGLEGLQHAIVGAAVGARSDRHANNSRNSRVPQPRANVWGRGFVVMSCLLWPNKSDDEHAKWRAQLSGLLRLVNSTNWPASTGSLLRPSLPRSLTRRIRQVTNFRAGHPASFFPAKATSLMALSRKRAPAALLFAVRIFGLTR